MTADPVYTLDILRLAASLPLETSVAVPSGRAEKRSPTCGSLIRTEVRLADGRIAELAQQVQACAFGQASAALVQGFAAGRSTNDIAAARQALADWLSGVGDPPLTFDVLQPARAKTGRHGAILLPFDALLAALRQAEQEEAAA